jgi:hypothetical protein
MTELIKSRVDEIFFLFAKVLPIYGEKAKTDKIFGIEFLQLVPDLSLTLADLCKKDLEFFDLYLDFIQQGIDYMRGVSNDLPIVDQNDFSMMSDVEKGIEEFKKNAEPTNF